MVKVFIDLVIKEYMKVIGLLIKWKVLVYLHGKMVLYIKECLKIIKNKEKVKLHINKIQKLFVIKDNFNKIKNKDMVFNGLKMVNILDILKIINIMDMENLFSKMELLLKVNGKMVNF